MYQSEVYNEDCLIGMDRITSKSIDMILCDLPYGTTQCKWDTIIPFAPLWRQYNRVIKDNGAIVLFAAEPFASHLRISNLKMYKYDWIWDKVKGTGFLNAKKQPMRNHEILCVFYKKQATYHPQKTSGHERKVSKASHKVNSKESEVYNKGQKLTTYDSDVRYPRSIQIFSTDTQNNSLHPTQKPVSLCEYLINTYSNIGETVLDNCMGSQTTRIACLNTGRNFIGFELDNTIFEGGNKRFELHRQQQTLAL